MLERLNWPSCASKLWNRISLLRSSNSSAATAPPGRNVKQRTGSIFEKLRKWTQLMLKPPHKVGKPPGPLRSLMAIITLSWLNLLLAFIPVSWALHFVLPHSYANRDTFIFVFSSLAIIPLAKLLSFATEEVAMRIGQTPAELLKITLENIVELIVAIIALIKCELQVVQASLVGSILTNLLLVLGMCFFAGGLNYFEQGFGPSATRLNSVLLTLSVIAVLLPAAFHFSTQSANANANGVSVEGEAILSVAIILLFIYAGYLTFQLWSHPILYLDKNYETIESRKYDKPLFHGLSYKFHHYKGDCNAESTGSNTLSSAGPLSASMIYDSENPCLVSVGLTTANSHMHIADQEKNEEKEETPNLSVWMTVILLVTVATLITITAEFLVDSIDGMTSTDKITKEFVGIILLPIVGKAAEHVATITSSIDDKVNHSLGACAGSSIQMALFVIPFVVTLSWILGKPLTLLFDPYESISLFLAVFIVNYVVQAGTSHWLEGFILMSLYFILAVTFWFYPGSDPSGGLLSTCH